MTATPKIHQSQLQHWGGFVVGGLIALAIDAAVLTLLTEWLGLSPYIARVFSISAAMVASWQINRRITFAVEAPPSLAEFARFAAVSWVAQTVNYAAFALILLIKPDMSPLIALVAASLIAMFVSYAGFRFGVFAKS